MRRATLYILIVLAYLGSNQFVYPLPLGIAVFPFRVWLPVALGVYLLVRQWGVPVQPRLLRQANVFLFAWLIYGAIQLVYAFDVEEGIRYWLFLATNILFAYLVCGYLNDMGDLNMYMRVCTAVLVGLLILATWEYTTGRHLLLSAYNVTTAKTGTVVRMLYSTQEGHRSLLYMPTGTFVNPNDFAYALVLLVPMVLGWMILTQRTVVRLLLAGVGLWSLFIISITQSRASLMSLLLVICPVFFLGGVTNPRTRLSIVAVVVLLVVAIVVGLVVSPQGKDIVARRLEEGLEILSFDYVRQDVRWALSANAFYFMAKTFGFGVGTRQTVAKVLAGEGVVGTGKVASTHNMWAEILGDYGLIIFVPLVLGYVGIMRHLWRHRQEAVNRSVSVHSITAMSMMLGMLPAALSPSGGTYLIPTFATLGYVLATVKCIAREDESPSWLPENELYQEVAYGDPDPAVSHGLPSAPARE